MAEDMSTDPATFKWQLRKQDVYAGPTVEQYAKLNLCTECGHDWEAHDVPDAYDGETPNPLRCPVLGCGCHDVRPTPDEVITMRMAEEARHG